MSIDLLIGSRDGNFSATLSRDLARDDGDSVGIRCRTTPPERLVACASEQPPDVLLLDVESGRNALAQTLARFRKISSATRILLLFEAAAADATIEALRHRVAGCLLKSVERSLFAKAVRAVHAGQVWFGRDALLQATRHLLGGALVSTATDAGLTEREQQVLQLTGKGLTNKEIARQLKISDSTVKTHLHRVYVKLNQSGRYKAYLSQPLEAPASRRDQGPG